ncbi:MAG TPA: DUF2568 domain-containing protein [Thermomicrobiales bacterium]|nr:DUF2568 domain-containing protein [Thermomicrobiales bacterium]
MPDRASQSQPGPAEIGFFFLDIAALAGLARWGWHLGGGGLVGPALALLFVLLFGTVWAVFRARGFVPNGGDPVVAIPGPARLGIELLLYLLAAWSCWVSGWQVAAVVLVICAIAIYMAMRKRTIGLLRNTPPAA